TRRNCSQPAKAGFVCVDAISNRPLSFAFCRKVRSHCNYFQNSTVGARYVVPLPKRDRSVKL
ncbi:MAG TPA: hypothetical protein V6C90_24220, partial [Coleofasciculaceae cyanobacterium]